MNKIRVALIGNPNVGKSTVFNALTGLKQHTGNWTGKTVDSAIGICHYQDKKIEIVDLPGTYSLKSSSEEEFVATNYILKKEYDVAVIVCDSVCLEKSLNLVLQVLEITNRVIVCLNLIDEASKKGIFIHSKQLESILHVPVVLTDARKKAGLENLIQQIINYKEKEGYLVQYSDRVEENISKETRYQDICKLEKCNPEIKDEIVNTLIKESVNISKKVVTFTKKDYDKKDRILDRIFTSKKTGIPIMIALLFLILWITISLSNYPSQLLFDFFTYLGDKLLLFFNNLSFPKFLTELFVLGIYKTVTWVVSVMLPPMAIFFPLFTILEDYGLLPRIAFNMDRAFSKCNACGKQCLTMLMGFGCNAVGVTGTRIIDSKREKIIAILTNAFVPCNGRFPTIIAMISMFFITSLGPFSSIVSAGLLTFVILLGILATLLISKILSKTILKGYPSSFILELPPYRRPKFISVITRSMLDRTLFVLGRAISISIPAGLILYLMANLHISDISILQFVAEKLNGFGNILGLDGMILLAFLLGFPANEIVIPVLLMGYLATGSLTDYTDLISLKNILINHGWTILTAINFILLTLFHYPCSTTILTIKKETGSIKWSIFAFIIPTLLGLTLCLIVHFLWQLFL